MKKIMTTITKSISDVLSEIQKKINVPKAQHNSFGKYNYRSCEDIVEAVKKILPNGFIITLEDEIIQIGDRYYVKATATITNNKSWVNTTAFAREPLTQKGMNEAQITGSTSSYARKYALNGLLLIDDTKDTDITEKEGEQIQLLEKHEEAIANIADLEELKKYYKANEGDGKDFAKLVTERKTELQK